MIDGVRKSVQLLHGLEEGAGDGAGGGAPVGDVKLSVGAEDAVDLGEGCGFGVRLEVVEEQGAEHAVERVGLEGEVVGEGVEEGDGGESTIKVNKDDVTGYDKDWQKSKFGEKK